jgi:hypothetical protein
VEEGTGCPRDDRRLSPLPFLDWEYEPVSLDLRNRT